MNRGGIAALGTLVVLAGCGKARDTEPASAAIAQSATAPATSPGVAPSETASSAALPIPAPAAAPDTIIAQHVLIAYRGAKRAPKGVLRSKGAAKARAQEALAKVRSGTAFEDVVDTYSDDTPSVDRMGSVGKFHRGDMDPAFSAAAFALKVEEVSGVVETPFGFHLIKRTQ